MYGHCPHTISHDNCMGIAICILAIHQKYRAEALKWLACVYWFHSGTLDESDVPSSFLKAWDVARQEGTASFDGGGAKGLFDTVPDAAGRQFS